jgi:hypothetical protein
VNRIKKFYVRFVGLKVDRKRLFQKGHELERCYGIEDPARYERRRFGQRFWRLAR